MKEDVSGSKFPTSVGSGVAVEFVPVELVEYPVELVGGLVLVPLFDCASAPITVKDKLTHSSSRIKPFLEVNKLMLSKLNTHNLYVMSICMTTEIWLLSSSMEVQERCCKYYL